MKFDLSILTGFVGGVLYDALKVVEAALPLNTSHDALRGHLMKAVRTAHGVSADSYGYPDGPYHLDTFPTHVAYTYKGQAMKRKYTVTQGAAGTDPQVTLGEPSNIHVAYVDTKTQESWASVVTTPKDEMVVSESSEFCMAPEECVEALIAGAKEAASTGKPTTIPIKIIGPGWGSMAYYSKEAIKESGPQVFTLGTHMYWNHPTMTEEVERPEGSLNDLAAVLTESAKWQDNGPKGPGLYAKAKVFSDFSTQIMEKGAHIGVSINSPIKFHEGEAEGKHGRIAEKFIRTPLTSADFVTRAGAKGAPIVPVQESDRRSQTNEGDRTMTPEQEKALLDRFTALEAARTKDAERIIALEADNRKLKEGENVTLAVSTVSSLLRDAQIEVRESIIRRMCQNPVMKEGKLDEGWLKDVLHDLSGLTVTTGVTGLGFAREAAPAQETPEDKALNEKRTKVYESALKDLGLKDDAAVKVAIEGRA